MNLLDHYLNTHVMVELAGKQKFTGLLVDYGLDVLVLYNGVVYRYIPLVQLHNIRPNPQIEQQIVLSGLNPMENQTENISLRNILSNAKGMFVEIYVSGNQTIHGYVTSMLTNYFVFYSPVYKTMFVALNHLKWLTPYNQSTTPYSLGKEHLPVHPAKLILPRTFEEQLKKLEGKLVIFDIGDHPHKIGLLQKVESNMVEIVTGEGEIISWNVQHLKAVYLP